MPWNGNINQYVCWNSSDDELKISMFPVIQGYGTEEYFSLVLSNDTEYDYMPSDTYPVIKRNDIIFSDFVNYDEPIYLLPTGYLYNGMPLFRSGGGAMFKSRSNEWIYADTDFGEPLLYIDNAKDIFSESVHAGDDLRDLSCTTLEQYSYFRLLDGSLDDQLTSDGLEFNFVKWDDEEYVIVLSSLNKVWRKRIISDQKFIITPHNKKYMKELSSLIGVYTRLNDNDRIFGIGVWEDDNQTIYRTGERPDNIPYTPWVYRVKTDDGEGHALDGYIIPVGYFFYGSFTGFNERPGITEFNLEFDGNATFSARDEHNNRANFSVPFKGWDIIDRDAYIFHAQHPWYR